MSKVLGIKEPDFFKLVKRMNEFNLKNQVFATQVFPIESENCWYALIYYESNHRQGKTNFDKATSFQKPSPPATPSQIKLMDSLKIKYDKNISKKEAQVLISKKLQ